MKCRIVTPGGLYKETECSILNIRTIDGQECPSNADVRAGRKMGVLQNHAAKGCSRCKENYAWRLKQSH